MHAVSYAVVREAANGPRHAGDRRCVVMLRLCSAHTRRACEGELLSVRGWTVAEVDARSGAEFPRGEYCTASERLLTDDL
jgi:hypothetical protein